MKAEVRIYKQTEHGLRAKKILVEHLCIFDDTQKRPTRTWVKKVFRRHFPQFLIGRWAFITKKGSVYHASASGDHGKSPYHFAWYYIEIEPIFIKEQKNECSRNLQCPSG